MSIYQQRNERVHSPNVRIDLPEHVSRILELLQSNGHEAYIVGGCVRDAIMGVQPSDWDVATSAHPKSVKNVFRDMPMVDVGIKHGTVGVVMQGGLVEITTYRQDGEYLDSRHPKSVTFVSSIEEDLGRRDFTMNAIAFSPRQGFVDVANGRQDISAKVIRSVGDPDRRFAEDALRIMRALRFSASLGFEIDAQLSNSLHKNAGLLNNIAPERLSVELMKLLIGENVLPVLLEYSDVLAVLIPEIKETIGFDQRSKYHIYDIWEHTARSIALSKPDAILRLALLMHDLGKPEKFFLGDDNHGHFYGHNVASEMIAEKRLRALRMSKATVETVSRAVHYHQLPLKTESAQKWLSRLGEDMLRLIIEIKRYDMATHAEHVVEPALRDIVEYERALEYLIAQQMCFKLKDLAINGDDLIAIGIPKGRAIGEILNYLLDNVVEGDLENNREELLKAAEFYLAPPKGI